MVTHEAAPREDAVHPHEGAVPRDGAEEDAALLEVQDLTVRYEPRLHPALNAVEGVSFAIQPGEFVGLIGESGSGKSTLGTAILRLTERPGRITGGSIRFDGMDITEMSQAKLRPYRWRDFSTVFQSSMNALNPVVRVEDQFRDAIELHTPRRGAQVTERIKEMFDLVLIDHRFIRAYPHELSGGMKQRVNLALALVNDPKFVLLDEPTTGLDVVVQRSILEGVRKLQEEQGFAVLFISHDIGTVMDLSDRILVMYAGRIVEEHDTDDLLREPLHPYTKGLLGSYGDPRQETVRITYVPGRPPDLSQPLVGCPFAPRCPERIDLCTTDAPQLLEMPSLRKDEAVTALRFDSQGTWRPPRAACHVARLQREEPETPGLPTRTVRFAGPAFEKSAEETERAFAAEVFLEVDSVTKIFHSRQGFRQTQTLAVDDVSFQLRRGMVTALVGQSGSGKSTLARLITGVDRPTSGSIRFHARDGEIDVGGLGGGKLRAYRSLVQMVFQDPYSSLNPNKTLEYILSRPLKNYRSMGRAELEDRDRRAAGAGRPHPGPPLPQPSRLRALRRPAPAGGDRPRARCGSGADHRRRADLEPGRVDPCRGARAAAAPGRRLRRGHPLHHPRPAQRPHAGRRCDRAEPGQGGRARPRPGRHPLSAGRLHQAAAGRHPQPFRGHLQGLGRLRDD